MMHIGEDGPGTDDPPTSVFSWLILAVVILTALAFYNTKDECMIWLGIALCAILCVNRWVVTHIKESPDDSKSRRTPPE